MTTPSLTPADESISPGVAHPNAPAPLLIVAEQFGVTRETMQGWCDAGLPQNEHGHIDPFEACNWLSWNRLSEAPALLRRWQNFLNWFYPFVQGQDASRRIKWSRCHRLYLPQAQQHLRWAIPRVIHEEGRQLVESRGMMRSASLSENAVLHLADWREQAGAWRLDQDEVPADLQARQELTVLRHVQRDVAIGSAEHQALLNLLEPLVADFRYGYRQHRIVDDAETAEAHAPDGSCLDCTLRAQTLLQQAGWNTRLCGGIIAHSLIANPHFWLEVRGRSEWFSIDVSLAAIARMLRLPWENWLAAYIGGSDARRILITRDTGSFQGLSQCQYISALTGALVVAGQDGHWKSAWDCIDWCCGSCHDSFDSQMLD